MLSCDPQDEVQSLSPEHDLHQVVTSTTTLHTQTLLSWFLSSSICSQFPLHVTYLPLQASAFISHNFLLSTCLLFSFSLAQEHYPPNSFPGRTLPLTLWYAFLSTSPCSVPSTSLNLSFFWGGAHVQTDVWTLQPHTRWSSYTSILHEPKNTVCGWFSWPRGGRSVKGKLGEIRFCIFLYLHNPKSSNERFFFIELSDV